MATLKQIRNELEKERGRSAWTRGVIDYAWELSDNIEQYEVWKELDTNTDYKATSLDSIMLNGAEDWQQYSWGGGSLIYDTQIAMRLCAPWELKKTNNGLKAPNKNEQWLDVQGRALFQAAHLIKRITNRIDAR